MSIGGTQAHIQAAGLPPLVAQAVDLARALGFESSCLPEQGRLLQVVVRGRTGGRVGETGTGCGVGLAWMIEAAEPETQFVSVEIDAARAAAAAELFRSRPNVTIVCGDYKTILDHAPFDLVVLDGGGCGKKEGEPPLDPQQLLSPGGAVVLDDFTPLEGWPPTHEGKPDDARLYWLEHPALLATEIRVTPAAATIVGVRR